MARYMKTALEKTDQGRRFNDLIDAKKERLRDWKAVQEVFDEVFTMKALAPEIAKIFFSIRPKKAEQVHAYAKRIEDVLSLVPTFKMQSKETIIGFVVSTLTDLGKESIKAKFGSVNEIESVQDLMDYIRETPRVLSGQSTDPFALFKPSISKDATAGSSCKGARPGSQVSGQEFNSSSYGKNTHHKRVQDADDNRGSK